MKAPIGSAPSDRTALPQYATLGTGEWVVAELRGVSAPDVLPTPHFSVSEKSSLRRGRTSTHLDGDHKADHDGCPGEELEGIA